MWTTKNRVRYTRNQLRYPSDVTEEEWAVIAPLIPPARRGGRKRSVNIREVFNGVLYILSTGCQWRAIPKDLPPRSTLFHSLAEWEADRTVCAFPRLCHRTHAAATNRWALSVSPCAAERPFRGN